MQIIFYAFMFIIGACIGSFLCCQARRLHLKSIPSSGKSISKKTSHKKSTISKATSLRSICLSCGYRLKWYDNIPILSWLFLKGKCRKCGKKIGLAELLSELGVGLAFLLVAVGGSFSPDIIAIAPTSVVLLTITLIYITIISFLAIYDGLYGELPTLHLTISVICAIIIVILRKWAGLSVGVDLLNIVFSVLILGGLYLVLYLISRGKWVGDGDWILGVSLALVLGHPWLALLVLFLANLLATIIMLPSIKRRKDRKIYFGPFLVIAFVVILAFSDSFYAIINLW